MRVGVCTERSGVNRKHVYKLMLRVHTAFSQCSTAVLKLL